MEDTLAAAAMSTSSGAGPGGLVGAAALNYGGVDYWNHAEALQQLEATMTDMEESTYSESNATVMHVNVSSEDGKHQYTHEFEFEEYAWEPFANLRTRFGISSAAFVRSVCENPPRGIASEGKSGMDFWITHDNKYIIKTLKEEEHSFLLDILPQYYAHMVVNGDHSLLSRYLGMVKIKVGREPPVVVLFMNCVFAIPPEVVYHGGLVEKYDIKGSMQGRYVEII